MAWNYRIILHDTDPDPTQHWMGLHEVYYDENDRPDGWGPPTTFVCTPNDGKDDIIRTLEMALNTLRDPRFSDVISMKDYEQGTD